MKPIWHLYHNYDLRSKASKDVIIFTSSHFSVHIFLIFGMDKNYKSLIVLPTGKPSDWYG